MATDRPSMSARESVVGVISDTHGLMRPEAIDVLRGSDIIVHAGDIGSPQVLTELARIAPTKSVRGNNDYDQWADELPMREVVEVAGKLLYIVHEMSDLDIDPVAADFSAIITGHTHRPLAELRDSVLYLNPGSAGPRRFKLPATLAKIWISDSSLRHEIVTLAVE